MLKDRHRKVAVGSRIRTPKQNSGKAALNLGDQHCKCKASKACAQSQLVRKALGSIITKGDTSNLEAVEVRSLHLCHLNAKN